MRVSRQTYRICSRIASIDVSKSITAYFARFFTAASTWVGNLLKSSTSELYIEPTGRNCLVGDVSNSLSFTGLSTFDSATVDQEGVGEVAITITGNSWTIPNGWKVNEIKLYNLGVLIHRFPLDKYKSGTSPSVVVYNCVETGTATAQLINGTVPDNLGETEGLSWGTLNGYSKAVQSEGVRLQSSIILQENDILEWWVRHLDNESTTAVHVYGMYDSANSVRFYGGTRNARWFIGFGNTFLDTGITADAEWHHFKLQNGNLLIDGESVGTVAYSSFGVSTTYMYLFGTFDGILFGSSFRKQRVTREGSVIFDAEINKDGDIYEAISDSILAYSNSIEFTIPALADGSGNDVAGLPVQYPAINGGRGANGGNRYKFTTVPQELIDIDTDNQFQVAGVATEWYPQDVAAAYIEKTVTANGSVTDLKIKK